MPKAFGPLCGEPLLAHALRGVLGCADVAHVVIVAPGSHLGQARDLAGQDPRIDVVAGGADRSASVVAGLAALRPDDGIVLVHDAVFGSQRRESCHHRGRPICTPRHHIHAGILTREVASLVEVGAGRHDDHVCHVATTQDAPKGVSQ